MSSSTPTKPRDTPPSAGTLTSAWYSFQVRPNFLSATQMPVASATGTTSAPRRRTSTGETPSIGTPLSSKHSASKAPLRCFSATLNVGGYSVLISPVALSLLYFRDGVYRILIMSRLAPGILNHLPAFFVATSMTKSSIASSMALKEATRAFLSAPFRLNCALNFWLPW